VRRLAPLFLLSITAIWGWTFVVVKEGMERTGPFSFLALRFGLATLVLGLLFFRPLVQIDRRALLRGALAGLALFAGYLFQTWGLVTTTATKSGLLTGLSVVMVPVIASLLYRQRVPLSAWGGAFLAVLGLSLLVLGAGPFGAFTIGDVLTLLCALSFAVQILLVDRYVRRSDYRALLVVEVAVVTLLSLLGAAVFEGFPAGVSSDLVSSILITGLLATALAFYVLHRFQVYSTASYTAIILTMEPVFAALFGTLLLGERLGALQIAGGIFILAGMALPQLAGQVLKEKR
jgi:drug/metabolite transporter (DMT)-like permease